MRLPRWFKSALPAGLKKFLVQHLRAREMRLPPAPRAFLFLAADYGNIGDLAITAAQQRFLSRIVPGHQVVPVPISATLEVIRSLRRQMVSSDLVTTVGGGNMGSLYPDIEELRQLVIRAFPNNRIICFPQTLDWDESGVSNKALRKIVRTYSRHPDIHVFGRESITRDKLADLFRVNPNVKVGFTPDIVLSATATSLGSTSEEAPAGILRCMRDDRERALEPDQYAQLDNALRSTGEHIEHTDTHAGGARLDERQCAQLLADKLDQFRAARLVVTDRLHGMILAALAGTPCLVLPNSNHKIRQTWQDWLVDVPQVRFLSLAELSTVGAVVDELLAVPRRNPALAVVDPSHYAALSVAVQSR